MKKSLWVPMAIVLVTMVTLLMIVTYNYTGSRIVSQIETIPGQHQSQQAVQVSQAWREVYDLELTGHHITPTLIAFEADQVVVGDPNLQEVIKVDLASKNYQLLASAPSPIKALLLDDEQVFVLGDQLYIWNETQSDWQALTPVLNFPGKVSDLERFGDHFYVFGEDLIAKLTFKNGEFISQDSWLAEEETPPGMITSAFIDGYIYTVSDSQVQQWLRGQRTHWSLEASPSSQLYLSNDPDSHLLILSPDWHSLNLFDAHGRHLYAADDPLLSQALALGYNQESGHIFTLIDKKFYQYVGSWPALESEQNISD